MNFPAPLESIYSFHMLTFGRLLSARRGAGGLRVSSGGRTGTSISHQHTCCGVSAFLSWGYFVDSKGQVFLELGSKLV